MGLPLAGFVPGSLQGLPLCLPADEFVTGSRHAGGRARFGWSLPGGAVENTTVNGLCFRAGCHTQFAFQHGDTIMVDAQGGGAVAKLFIQGHQSSVGLLAQGIAGM